MSISLYVVAAALSWHAHAAPSAAELEQAGNLFAITCSSSFCHGEGGVGARGPALRNRDFTPDFVRNTILNGRSGTPMPSFRGSLSEPELNMIVAYVMSLSPNKQATETTTAAEAAPAPAVPLTQQEQQGAAIFFNETRPAGCALCHSYGEHGGPIGPDLSAMAKNTPREIYAAMTKPSAADPGYQVATVTTADSKRFNGILKQQPDRVVQLYDLSSIPPVLRSFYPTDGVKMDTAGAGPLYTHDLAGYSQDEIASLIAFLKSAEGAGKTVTPQDFAQP